MIDIKEPICLTGILPKNPTIKDVHNDFALFLKKGNRTVLGKRALSETELNNLVKFWNLKISNTKEFIGDIPYYNQLEIIHFLESNPKVNEEDILIIATSDQLLDIHSIKSEIASIRYKLQNKYSKLEKIENELRLAKDPIVVLPYDGLYLVITAWGPEEKALWNLPSLS